MPSNFPDSVWDGLSSAREHPSDVRDGGDADYKKSVEEIVATQTTLKDLITPAEAVPSPTGGATEDAEARAAIDLIIARLVAKGLLTAEE